MSGHGTTSVFLAILLTVQLCRFSDAQAGCHLDLAFVVDQSGSICRDELVNDCDNWREMKRFLVSVVNSMEIGLKKTRVGLVTFRTGAEFRWGLDDFVTRDSLVQAINDLPYKPWGRTNAAAGLEMMRNKIFNTYGDRPEISNIAIIVTDGKPTVSVGKTIPEADEAKKAGIRIYSVGITDAINNDTLQLMSSSPQKLNQNYFQTPDFSGLQNVFRQLVQQACSPNSDLQGCAVIDLVFLVDMSGSICDRDPAFLRTGGAQCDNWDMILSFMVQMINNLQIGYYDVRVGLVTFSQSAKRQWGLDGYTDKLLLTRAIRALEYEKFGTTNTAEGLRVMRTEVFSQDSDRPGVRNVGLIITDGKPTVNTQRTQPEAELAKKDIEMYVVGITDEIDANTMRQLSGGRQQEDVNWFRSPDFSQLSGLIEGLLNSACAYEEPEPANDDSEGCALVDLVFVVDESGSICDNDEEFQRTGRRRCGNWNLVINFLENSVQSLTIGRTKVQVGLITFRSEAILQWKLNVYGDKSSLLEAIRGLEYQSGGNTFTADALKMMRTEVFSSDGDRPTARNVAIVITDGLPTDGRQRQDTIPEAIEARKSGIQIFVVGVTNLIDESTLQQISSLPQEENKNYFTSPDFAGLASVLESVMKSACSPLETCTKSVDVAFAIDSSGSIGSTNYETVLEFVRTLVGQLRVGDGTRVGLITYNDTSQVRFHLKYYDDGSDILSAIGKIPYVGGTTNTYDALKTLREQIYVNNNGDLSTAPNVAIVITDGKSNDPNATWKEAIQLRKSDVHLIAVGVGDEVVQEELRGIASYPTESNVYGADSFDDLSRLSYYMGTAMCNDIDECNSSPCNNGGTCRDLINGYECRCQRFNTGLRCERDCSGSADLLFIIDRSGSIPHERFDLVKDFIVRVLGQLEVVNDKVRVAATAFHDDAEVIFDLSTYKSRRNMEEVIYRIPYMGGKTNIASALQAARTQVFQQRNGDRVNVPNYVIIFTDGEANIRPDDTIPEAVELRLAGVHVITVSVGKHVDTDNLRGMASWPTSKNMFSVVAFPQLSEIIIPVASSMCDDNNECLSNPCQNGGTCVDGLGQYLCVCRGDKTGRNCERTCMKRLDVAFVVDISGSPENVFDSAKMFIRDIVHGLEFRGDTARAALITYSNKAVTLFRFDKYSKKDEVLDAISFPRTGGNTNMQQALAMAKTELFQTYNGDRSGVDNKLILLTDGCSDINIRQTVPNANALRTDRNVDIHVVAIGNRVDMDEVNGVANSPEDPYVVKVADSSEVSSGAQRILDHFCK